MKGTPAQVAALVGRSERTIWRWIASGKLPYKKLPGGLIEVEDSLLIEPEEGQQGVLLAMLARIESKLDALSVRVGNLEATVSNLAQPGSQPQVTHHARIIANLPPGPAQGELPEGLMAWRDYARQQGYAETTVQRRIDDGLIPVHRGRWKRGRGYVEVAIDDSGKQAMDALFSGG